MNFATTIKSIRISPKKLRFLVVDTKKQKPLVAIAKLQAGPWKGGRILAKIITNALLNASSKFNIDKSDWTFQTIKIDEGMALKRMRPGSKGMSNLYKKRSSHITIALTANPKALAQSTENIDNSDAENKNSKKIKKSNSETKVTKTKKVISKNK